MSLTADLTVATRPNAVAFTFTVHNEGDERVELTFPSGKVADVVVREDGEAVWRWSEGRMFTQALETRTIAPGDDLSREFTWEDPRPGEFTAEATLEAADALLSAGGRFSLT